jgi:hypothetical protein
VSLVANIPAGVPGAGGEIAYGEGAVWVTMNLNPAHLGLPRTLRTPC